MLARLQTRQLERNGIEADFFFSTLQGSPLYLHPTIYLFLLHEIFRLHVKWRTTGLALEPVWCWSAGHFTPNSIGWLVWLAGWHTFQRQSHGETLVPNFICRLTAQRGTRGSESRPRYCHISLTLVPSVTAENHTVSRQSKEWSWVLL